MKAEEATTLPTDVYLSFVSSLFGNRGTLFTGMIVHLLSCVLIYRYSGSPFYLWLAIAFVSVFAYRLYWFHRFDQVDKDTLSGKEIRSWEISYVYGAAATALLLGIASGYAIMVLRDTIVAFMCIAITMASMVSIVGRNYGSQLAVNLQTLGCCLPIVVACFFTGEIHLILMSLFLLPFGITTRSMANGVKDFLYRNVLASRDLARIAGRFDLALKTISHGLIMVDEEGFIQVVNRQVPNLLRLKPKEVVEGQPFWPLLENSLGTSYVKLRQAVDRLQPGASAQLTIGLPDRSHLDATASLRSDGGFVLVFEDVTSRIAAEEKIRHMACYDSLTDLPNARYFGELCTDHLAGSGSEAGLILLDVEGFRHVNDVRGHSIGDALLKSIATRLLVVANTKAIVARMIGDRFAVLLSAEGQAEVQASIEGIHAALQGTYDIDQHRIPVALNGGYAILEADRADLEGWQIKADLALNDAKTRGNGVLSAFRPEMDAIYLEGQKLRVDLRQAIQDEALAVFYQPMYSPDGTAIRSCEALARWTHPEKGPIPPNIFIPLAEDMGLVSEITRFVIDRACRDCAAWPQPIAVSVNLSVNDLHGDDIIGWATDALARHDLPASRLHVEVTESFFMEEPAAVCALLEALRAMGITISIDDFGTGFSSLSYLDSLPLDVVKIDRAFVRNVNSDPKRVKLLKGIVHLTRELGLKVVVEGVETKQQLALLNKYRLADIIQGFLFSPPVTSEAVANLLADAGVLQEMSGN
nr:phosphodiesterase [Rhizobium sp. Q54]